MQEALKTLGLAEINKGCSTGNNWLGTTSNLIESYSPVDGKLIGKVAVSTKEDYEAAIAAGQKAYKTWRVMPAPLRGEIVRQFGNKLRDYKEPLGKLVSYEMGKSYQEGLGEVQEMIDICDFAVGLSRQLNGMTMHSERPGHRMYDQYHPLGVVGIISAFNFPVAVWAWNTALAWICGNVCIWKPSEKAPMCGVACQNIMAEVLKENDLPEGICAIVNGDYKVGEWMTNDKRVPLISATGSTRMGRIVGATVAERFGKSILELGGNNAIIVTPSADLQIAIPGIVFGSVGTCGQRCTTTRRLIIHESIYDQIKTQLIRAYEQLDSRIGNPLSEGILIGPMIDAEAVKTFQNALEQIKKQGGTILTGGESLQNGPSGLYVRPVLAEAENHWEIVQEETFGPLLYLIRYQNFDDALKLQNDVPQGLSSAIFTNYLKESERFLSHAGSDCGLANVNIGTSGAEIGGAFGGEKDTGGGRESGSDAWKAYMRRQTNTINYSPELPLAQGITFDLG